jgi:putative peptidoglycan lipid II flippase
VQLVVVPAIALVCLVLLFCSRGIIHLSDPVLSGVQLNLSIRLWHWMLPSVILASVTAFFLAELIAEHKFLCQGLNQLLLNLSIVGVAILGWRFLGVFSLAAGVLLGFTAQLLLQTWTVLKGRRLFLTSPSMRPPVFGKALSMIGPVMLLHFMGALNQPIPRRFAAQFGDGSLAAFTYAMRAWVPILLVGVLSISYPYFSSFAVAVHDDRDQARRLLRSMLQACVLFALPAMSAVTVLRYDIVRVLFFRGAFDARAAATVSSTIAYLSPFLAGSLIADLLARCLVALRRPLLACSIYGLMLLLIWLVAEQTKRFGVNAIALGWSACFYAGAICFFFAVTVYLPGVLRELLGPMAKIAIASGISAMVMLLVSHSLNGFLRLTLSGSVIRIGCTVAIGTVVMVGISWMFGISEVRELIRAGVNGGRGFFKTWSLRKLGVTR